MKHQKDLLSRAIGMQCVRRTLLGATILTLLPSLPVLAQSSNTEELLTLEEIVVTARRKDESIQEVPLTVNVVSAETLDDLNVRKFEDLQAVVAGLTLQEDNIAPNASIRGVRFDTFASGFNPTVEFYLNDAPIVSLSAMQAMFDIGQIEVLRGPQGTLRGRASPSGSITITTRRPELDRLGGYVDITATAEGGENIRGALNLPLIEDKLGLRLAGFYESNDRPGIKSITTGESSDYEGDGWRASLSFQPTDNLAFHLMHQEINPDRTEVQQVESAHLATGGTPSGTLLKDSDRKGVVDKATKSSQEFERTNLEVQWDISEFQFNYAGSLTKQSIYNKQNQDFGEAITDFYFFHQELDTVTEGESHEVRFQTTEALFGGVMDFVVGALYQHNEPTNELLNPTLLSSPFPIPAVNILEGWTFIQTPISTEGESEEQSIFANVTFYLSDATELSVGLREIDYENSSKIVVSGNTLSDVNNDWSDTIYSASLKHQFTEELMAYFSYGTSWRPGLSVVGDFSDNKTPLEESFLNLAPETSDSYEVGIKSDWLGGSLRINLAAYYQEFDNYPYRAGGEGIYFIYEEAGSQRIDQFNFVGAVPVTVKGIEIESFYQITQRWNASALLSWSKGEIDNGLVPCNDYGGNVPSVADITAATGGDHLAVCNVSYRSNYAPLWTVTLQSEYSFPVASMEGYVRGLMTLYGDSKNDPANELDDVDAYNTVNVYAGIRQPEGKWEVNVYAKNLFDTEEVISREATPYSVSYRDIALGGASAEAISDYRGIRLTPEREVGLHVQYNF